MVRTLALILMLLSPTACLTEAFCGRSSLAACSRDSDCRTAGCSGQLCVGAAAEGAITSCEWKDCYDDKAYGLTCGCDDGQCAWN